MNDDQLQEVLREMRDEVVPPDSLARVRSRVALGTARRVFRLWSVPALGLLGVAVVLVTFSFPRATPPVPPPPSLVTALPPLADRAPEPDPEVQAVPHRVRVAHHSKRTVRRAPSVPLQIRIETDDPDVVILLTGE